MILYKTRQVFENLTGFCILELEARNNPINFYMVSKMA